MQAGGQRFESVILHFVPQIGGQTIIDILPQEKKSNKSELRYGIQPGRIKPSGSAERHVLLFLNEQQERQKAEKGVRRMPRLRKAKKDAASCEKPRVGACDR